MPTNCPDEEIFIEYFSNTLEDKKRQEIEEHALVCDHCSQKSREISLNVARTRIAKSRPILGLAWKKYGDLIEAKAAGEKYSHNLQEYITNNGKYIVTLRPLEKNPELSLLEIEVQDHLISGYLRVSTYELNELLEIDENHMAYKVVSSSIDLHKIIISVEK